MDKTTFFVFFGFLSSVINCCLHIFAVIASQCAHWRGNPPVLPPVIPSERSESRDLACSFTFQLRLVRRSFDSLRSLRMTVWVEGWGLGGKSGGLPHQCAHWFAKTGNLGRIPTNTNLPDCRAHLTVIFNHPRRGYHNCPLSTIHFPSYPRCFVKGNRKNAGGFSGERG